MHRLSYLHPMRRLLPLLLVLALAFLPSPAGAKLKKKGWLTGKFSNQTYTAPHGLFQVSSPVSADFDGELMDGPGFVSFTDEFGRLYRFEYMELTTEAIRQRKEFGDRAFFENFMTTVYLPNTIWKAIPKTRLVGQKYAPENSGPLLLSWMFLPHGSVYTVWHGDTGLTEREDAYRAVALFIRGNYLFVLSVVPSGPDTTVRYKENPDELRAKTEAVTLKLAAGIQVQTK